MTCTCAECAPVRAELDSLRTATQLAQARADVRDAAKRDTAALLGLPVDASVHQVMAAIRVVVEERDALANRAVADAAERLDLRLVLTSLVARVRRTAGYATPEEQCALWAAEALLR